MRKLLFSSIVSFFCFSLLSFEAFCGKWKESFATDIGDSHQLNHIDMVHRGLAYKVGIEIERKPSTQCVNGEDVDVTYNNIGICFFNPTSKHYSRDRLKNPTNTTNYAAASIEYIYRKTDMSFGSYFLPLYDKVEGGNHFIFSSKRTDLSVKANQHLLVKTNPDHQGTPIPEDYDDPLYEVYKPLAHSEDKIVCLFHKNWKAFLSQSVEKIREQEVDKFDKVAGVFLHIHTRFDMCGSCEYALDWELQDPNGVAQILKKHAVRAGKDYCEPDLRIAAFVSSSQPHLVWGAPRRTLLYGPPIHTTISPLEVMYRERYSEFRQQISIQEIDGQKKALKKIIVPFSVPITDERENGIFVNSCGNDSYWLEV